VKLSSRILIIDDEKPIVDILKYNLEKMAIVQLKRMTGRKVLN
jgi:hypothetical protein